MKQMLASTVRLPAPRSGHPLIRALRFVWTLPTNVLGHLLGLFVGGGRAGRVVRASTAVGVVYSIRIKLFQGLGAITIGNAILFDDRYLNRAIHSAGGTLDEVLFRRLVLAHELAHTRQHDLLGPLYLPAHLLAQLVSAVGFLLDPNRRGDPIHAHNPLEQSWICLGHDALFDLWRGERLSAPEREKLLRALGA